MTYYLEIMEGPDKGKKFSLQAGQNVVGKSPGCGVCVQGEGVSRRHCTITLEGDTPVLEDNGSKNGTYVNDTRVKTVELCAGDVIRLAKASPLRLETDVVQTESLLGEETLAEGGISAMGERADYTRTITESVDIGDSTVTCCVDNGSLMDDVGASSQGTLEHSQATLGCTADGEATRSVTGSNSETFIQAEGESSSFSKKKEEAVCDVCSSGNRDSLHGATVSMDDGTGSVCGDRRRPANSAISSDSGSTGTDSTGMTGETVSPDGSKPVFEDYHSKTKMPFFVLALVILLLIGSCIYLRPPSFIAVNAREMKHTRVAAFEALDSTGQAQLFSLVYPSSAESTVSFNGKDEQEVTTYVAGSRKIRLHILLKRETDLRHLQEDFMQGMKEACRRLDSRLTLHEGTPALMFFYPADNEESAPNGIRYASSTYLRIAGHGDEEERYYGTLTFFRHDATNYLLLAEVYESDKDIMTAFLNAYQFLSFDNAEFIKSGWEGGRVLEETDEDFTHFCSVFHENREARLYPIYETQLKRFMLTYKNAGNDEQYKEAHQLFMELREHQKTYYNKLRIRYSQIAGRSKEAQKKQQAIQGEAEQVFVHQDDARYRKIRQKNWQWLSPEDKKAAEKAMGKGKKKSRRADMGK